MPHSLVMASSSGDVVNPKTWSSTPSRLWQHLAPRFRGCESLNYQLDRRLDFAMRATSRLFRGWNCARNTWFNSAFERAFQRRWNALPTPPNACLHISDFCIPPALAGQARHFIYTDSTLPGIARHQPRPVRSGFIADYCRISRRYLKRTEMVFTMNEWTRQSFVEHHGFPAEQIINARFGINIAPWMESKDFNRRLMLIVLRPKLEEIKGLNLLLAAWPEIRRAIPNVELTVVGTYLKSAPSGVTCCFNQPREKTIELMRSATLFTMPALCEPNGIVYMEALASRTPILGLDRMAFPELAGRGKYGFIVKDAEPGQCARTVIDAFSDPNRLRRMGEEGQKFAVENYSWERTSRTMADAICVHLSAA